MSETCEALSPTPMGQITKPDIREGLMNRKTRLEQQLADVNAAIEALDANPQVARLLELVGKASRY